ncbi:LysE family translocator [Roseateles sp. DAIF2]|uniref:LysE family translocator n=1 Tax=Roseateles sp. DAIF2 TaxID=2714952 RepID=UPI0018A31610|nr:LysE family translocator [Roseateles sp. DAIF2]QPF71977.1 LysE family translocator [Roseateles sp. DAIF2]
MNLFSTTLTLIDPSTLLAFTLLNMSFALIPGPDMLCILSNAVTRGYRAGAWVCGGIACAALVHVAAAALGLTTFFLHAVPMAFLALKAVGAAYLVWLGWQMLRSPASLTPAAPRRWAHSPFAQGAVSNLLNPKIALFFLAILPQFIDPAAGHPGLQAALLGLVSIVSGTAVNLCTAALGGRARRWILTRLTLFQRFQQLAGGALIALGCKVALERAR